MEKLSWSKEKKEQTYCSYILWTFLTDEKLNIPIGSEVNDDMIWYVLRERDKFAGFAELSDRIAHTLAN